MMAAQTGSICFPWSQFNYTLAVCRCSCRYVVC